MRRRVEFGKSQREPPVLNGAGSGLTEQILKTISERPLIGHGSSRYEQMKVAERSATRVEPREIRPLQSEDCKGFFVATPRGEASRQEERRTYEREAEGDIREML